VNVTLDQYLRPGENLTAFMERSIRENDFVLVVCTPKYCDRSNGRQGGVGFEGNIMTADIMLNRDNSRFIPLLRSGRWTDSAPSWLSNKLAMDFRGSPYPPVAFPGGSSSQRSA
jgi:hypothetical protein